MSASAGNFHHIGIISDDLHSSVQPYEKLGFSFTAVSQPHIALREDRPLETVGIGHRTAIFRDNYLELLGVIDEPRWREITTEQRVPFDIDVPLRRYQGLHVLHLAADDIEAVRQRLKADGFLPSQIGKFEHLVATEFGDWMIRARSLSFPPGTNPEALIQFEQPLRSTRSLQSSFVAHANGAISHREVVMCVENPRAVAERYAAFAGATVRSHPGVHVVRMGNVRIVAADTLGLERIMPGVLPPTLPWLAAFSVATKSLEQARRVLALARVPFRDIGDRILVRPADAGGCGVFFEEECFRP